MAAVSERQPRWSRTSLSDIKYPMANKDPMTKQRSVRAAYVDMNSVWTCGQDCVGLSSISFAGGSRDDRQSERKRRRAATICTTRRTTTTIKTTTIAVASREGSVPEQHERTIQSNHASAVVHTFANCTSHNLRPFIRLAFGALTKSSRAQTNAGHELEKRFERESKTPR